MRWLSSLIFLLWAFSVYAAYVVVKSGRRIDGVKISASANGSVTLVTAQGQRMTFRKGQYRRAVVDKPREFSQAEKLMKAGRGAEAVALLEKVKTDYHFLSWDQQAIRLLANYYYDSGMFAEATVEFQALEVSSEVEREKCRQALIQSGQADVVLPELEKEIASGSREAAARAYLMRGDLKATNGDLEGARRDWLKVATFFKAQKDVAKQAVEKLGNHEIHQNRENLSL